MKPENIRMSLERAKRFVEVGTAKGEKSSDLIEDHFVVSPTRGVFRMDKMKDNDVSFLCNELLFLSTALHLTDAERKTFSTLYYHARSYLRTMLGTDHIEGVVLRKKEA